MSLVKQGKGTALPWFPKVCCTSLGRLHRGEGTGYRYKSSPCRLVVGRSGALCDRSALQESPSPSLGLAVGMAASCAELSSYFAPR